jgi:FtsP/CotA-like multicopper oxidase with cupredoxin domain
MLLHDWRHKSYHEVTDGVLNVQIFDLINLPKLLNLLPPGDGNLINGRAFTLGVCVFGIGPGCNQDFSKAPKWTVEKGKRYKIRLVNVGGDGTERFGTDGHRLTVISTDCTQIEPYETDIVTLGVGQRADVILTANDPKGTGAYWIRNTVAWCITSNWNALALGALYYAGADTTKQPSTEPVAQPFVLSTTALCGNDPIEQSKPWYPMNAVEPTTTLTFNNFYTLNSTGHLKFAMSFPGSYSGNYSSPLLYSAAVQGASFPANPLEWDPNKALFNPNQVYDLGASPIIRIVVNNPTFAQNAHAMHLHGHDFQVLSNGAGFWDGETIQTENPMRRDTQIVVPDGHLVFQYEANNPGLWALHCHIPWHVADGLVVNFMVSLCLLVRSRSTAVKNEH